MAKWLITRFQTLWPRRDTMLWHLCQSTLSKPHQIQWVWINFCCSRNSLLLGIGVLKGELCVYPPALFEATGTMLQSDKSSQANAIQGWVQPSSNPPGYELHLWWRCSDPQNSMENLADLWVTVWKVYWVCQKRNITNQSSVWWLPSWSFYRRQFPSEMEEIIFLLERGNLGTLLKRAFLSVNGNQWKYFFVGWWNGDTN